MAWKPLETDQRGLKAYIEGQRRAKRTKFLVDENLGPDVAEGLREVWGVNAKYVGEAGLEGKDDQAVFAYAWRERRVLLTHDRDFLDERLFPEHRNPGVVVLPGGSGDMTRLVIALDFVVDLMGRDPDAWRGAKVTIGADREVAIKCRDHSTGEMRITRYLPRNRSDVLVWED